MKSNDLKSRSIKGAAFLPVMFSRVRAAILEELFEESGRARHTREMERLTGLSFSSLQKELKKLSGVGVLREQVDGNRVRYQANPEHPCHDELCAMVRKMAAWTEILREQLAATEGVQQAWIFGSYASGELEAGSDIDLLVVGSLSLRELISRLKPAAALICREINPKLYSPEDWKAARSSNNAFLSRVFNNDVIRLV
jgi:predicted nucleotidyltransferase